MEAKRRQLDPEATRAAILDAARELFLTKGYAATSMSQVAKSARVTKSLIHHHFENKANLWLAVKTELFQEYGEAQHEILVQEGEPIQLLKDSFTIYFKFLKARPEVVRLLSMIHEEEDWHTLSDEQDEEIDAGPVNLFRLGVERIAAAQEAGLIRADIEPISLLSMFFNLTEHWFESRTRCMGDWNALATDVDGLDAMDERYLSDTLKVLLGGILGEKIQDPE